MSEGIAVALIVTLGSVLATAIPALIAVLAKLHGSVKAVQEQVANEHINPDGSPLKLRDDLDEKHDEQHGILLAIQRDVAWIMRRQAATDDRVDQLEETTGELRRRNAHHPPLTRRAAAPGRPNAR